MKYRLSINIDFEECDDPSARMKAREFLSTLDLNKVVVEKDQNLTLKFKKLFTSREPITIKL